VGCWEGQAGQPFLCPWGSRDSPEYQFLALSLLVWGNKRSQVNEMLAQSLLMTSSGLPRETAVSMPHERTLCVPTHTPSSEAEQDCCARLKVPRGGGNVLAAKSGETTGPMDHVLTLAPFVPTFVLCRKEQLLHGHLPG
jgi:hypothetical protein